MQGISKWRLCVRSDFLLKMHLDVFTSAKVQ